MDSDRLAGHFEGVTAVFVPGIDDVARFERPARGADGRAALVVAPADIDEVRAVVRVASAEGVRLLAQGANSGLVGASVPPADPPTVVLSTERLRSAPVIDIDGTTATVAAGTRLSELNGAAAIHGLHLPIDLGADPAIGGMIATNTGGSRVLRYGAMRRYVLAAEVVAADDDASVFGSLAAVRKDSRGLDATQLAIGSGGTLGVITGAVVDLVPLPRSTQTWWLAVEDTDRLVELLATLERRRPGALSAFELVSRAAFERTLGVAGTPANPFGDAVPNVAVLAEWSFAGDGGGVEEDIDAACDAGLLTDGRLVDPASAWGLRHRVSESLRTLGTVLGHDVSVPRSSLMKVRRRAIDAVAVLAPAAVMCDFGHAGDGGLHLNVLFPNEVEPPSEQQQAAIRRAIDDLVIAAGGSYSAEHGLGPLNAERWLATTPPIEQHLVAALKDIVDPHRILGHPAHPYNRL
ncbi:MAG TPA: FAD-binding oxidoreductase [Desertimonas sp.]|nr:FAD-binding oxidoreductase [Desertimonas sp.]